MRDMPAPIAAYAIGSGATIAVLMLITLIVCLVVSKPPPTAAGVVAELLCWAAVVAALAYGYRTFTATGLDRLRWQDMAAGAVITLAVQEFWILWSAYRRQKAAAEVA
jgi:riboflavin transporter FmnP